MAKKTNETVEEIMKKQLSLLESGDKLAKLEKDSVRDKKIIQELKEREKVTTRTLVLFERKIKYLKEKIVADLLKVCKFSENLQDEIIEEDNVYLEELNEKLYEICNNIEEATTISENDKAFILNKEISSLNGGDTQSRFDKLKANFNEKIGTSVLRKPGRPKKEEQSILADIGLSKKVEKIINEESETKKRLNDLFYGTPVSRNAISTIPQTEDSLFDFAEALNPNNSLKDIMADIMTDLSAEEPKVYNKDNIDSYILKTDMAKSNNLESGFIEKPNLKKFEDIEYANNLNNTKLSHKNGILTGNNLFEDIKK